MDQQPNPPDVDAFLDSTLVGDDPALAAALAASDAAELPRIAVSAQQGKFLCLLAGAIQARRVLEIGTLVLQHHLAGAWRGPTGTGGHAGIPAQAR